jgi:predicted lipid-binding transport protein (Tim44 family)
LYVHLDILIFAVIAAVLIYRLNAVLGTRHGDERPRPNPFAPPETPRPPQAPVVLKTVAKQLPNAAEMEQLIDPAANTDGRIETGLAEIAAVDTGFNALQFMAGAKYAFETIVTSYAKGERAALKPLLSPKLYADFDHGIAEREVLGHVSSTNIQLIKAARMIEAHLGGTMAYVTIDYTVEQTTVTRDNTGAVVSGSPDTVTTVEDIWTFTRDTRSSDPNWILIETRAAEKPVS